MFLANALKLKNRVVSPFSITDVAGLKAWYQLKTGQTVSSGNLTAWADSSGNTTEDMDLDVVTNVIPIDTSTGAVNFNSTNKGAISTSGDQLNLGAFTIIGVVDVVESGASNEAVLGRAGNDEFRLFRGSASANMRLRANGINYDINMSAALPTGKFMFTLSRASNGTLDIRIDSVSKGNVATTITDLFDFTRLGNGSTDSFMYEIAIFNVELSSADREAVEGDIKTRNGI